MYTYENVLIIAQRLQFFHPQYHFQNDTVASLLFFCHVGSSNHTRGVKLPRGCKDEFPRMLHLCHLTLVLLHPVPSSVPRETHTLESST